MVAQKGHEAWLSPNLLDTMAQTEKVPRPIAFCKVKPQVQQDLGNDRKWQLQSLL